MDNTQSINLTSTLDAERLQNTRVQANVRIVSVGAFFLLHLLLGHILSTGAEYEKFRGKETAFLAYLGVSGLLWIASHRSQKFTTLSSFGIPFVDIPFIFFILDLWTQNLNHGTLLIVGTLCLSFMLFLMHLSSYYFSWLHNLLSTFMAMLATVVLQFQTNVYRDTIIVSTLLLFCMSIAVHYKNVRFQRLVKKLFHEQKRREKMSRYFSPSVAELLQRGSDLQVEGKEMDITVLFADIRNFTQMSETMTGPELVKLLNTVHERFVSCIFSSNGTLDKYIGDGVMAYFGAPVVDPLHADKAVECASKMRAAIESLNKERALLGLPDIAIGIGIHSGLAIVGDVGAEFRREFTVIGDTVNTASRIESLTKKHNVDFLASETVRERMKDSQKLKFISEDSIRGKLGIMRTYTFS